MQFGHFR